MTSSKRWTARRIAALKGKEKIAMLTAYDFPTSCLADAAGAEILLVGDSLGMVVLGYENTLPVTLEEMIHHTKAVIRARKRSLVVTDLPFMTFQSGAEDALRNAGRVIKEGGADAVKFEGGQRVVAAVVAITEAGIPVMGHLGLTPQSVLQLGGYRVQGREEAAAAKLIEDAKLLEEAGIFALVLEGIPSSLARRVTESIRVPTIGIGAGPDCDGQVLVWHDVLGLYHGQPAKFVRQYAQLAKTSADGLERFVSDVKDGNYPSEEESYQ